MKFVLIAVCLISLIACNKEKKDKKTDNTWFASTGVTPPTIHPLESTTGDASQIQSFVLEGLLDMDPDTLDWRPALAESYEISDDGMTFTFKIRKGVTWHDGKPLTAHDVKFSFDIIFRDDYQTQRMRPYFENFESPTLVDDYTIIFKAKKKYFKNFDVLGSGGFLAILPKHIYDQPQDKDALHKILLGTGPYIFEEIKRGKWAKLKRNPNWWGRKVPHMNETHHFDRVIVRFVKGETAQLENFKKGNLSFLGLTPEQYMKKTEGGNWGKKYHKVKIQNNSVKGYGYVAFNFKNEIFASKNVRVALTHLMNRQQMIEKFLFNFSVPATGPLYQQNPYSNPSVKALEFDPKKALEILRADGWSDTDGDQVLDKVINGVKKSLKFTILIPSKDSEKYLTIFKEDARKAGVDISLKLTEWNTFTKKLDERSFEAATLAWGGGSVQWDPKQIWHSQSINGGSNFISYSNPEVDKLIDEARITMDPEKRKPILHRVYKLIAEDAPYIFLFNRKFDVYGYQDGLWRPKDTFNYTVGTTYWKYEAL